MKIFLFFLGIFFVLGTETYAQSSYIKLEGIIHGYEQAEKQGFLKKNKPTLLEGTLPGTTIRIFREDKLVRQLESNEQGLFSFKLDFDALYQISISKKGYNLNQLIVDTRAFPSHIKKGGLSFKGLEFVLNSYQEGKDASLDKHLGRLYFSPAKQVFMLEETASSEQGGLFASPPPDTPLDLLKHSIKKNNELLASYKPLAAKKRRSAQHSKTPAQQQSKEPDETLVTETEKDTTATALTIPEHFNLNPALQGLDESTIIIQEDAIRREREQLLQYRFQAKTNQDSLEIARREQQILLAEREIAHARLLISSQEERLSAQKYSLYMMVSLLVLLSVSTFFVFTYFRQKQKTSQLIESKNKQITDSINYARRIQQSILISEDILQQHLPESFVFLKPKAIVSGDFYFIAPVGQKLLVAVADCTGHGVPGAFMSLIGHRLLREIVVEKGTHDPSQVLEKLHTGINDSLNQAKGVESSQDGMDVAVCLIDPEARTLTFAGAMNPAYLVHEQELQVLPADVNSVGGKTLRPSGEKDKRKFTNKACQYSSGCMLYLFTDGYMDQFGGDSDQKFNTKRFKQLLLDIQPLSAAQQKQTIASTLKEWKKATPQTDDILLLGIRL